MTWGYVEESIPKTKIQRHGWCHGEESWVERFPLAMGIFQFSKISIICWVFSISCSTISSKIIPKNSFKNIL